MIIEVVNGSLWDIVTSLATVAAALGGIVAFFIALRALQLSKEGQRHQLFYTYFREYRTPEMGKAVQALRTFFEKKCRGERKRLVKEYVKLYNRQSSFHHKTRRVVSTFYQEIAVLVHDRPELQEIVYALWKKDDLSIIEDILLPIEAIAIPVALGKVMMPKQTELSRRSLPAVLKAMYDLHHLAPD